MSSSKVIAIATPQIDPAPAGALDFKGTFKLGENVDVGLQNTTINANNGTYAFTNANFTASNTIAENVVARGETFTTPVQAFETTTVPDSGSFNVTESTTFNNSHVQMKNAIIDTTGTTVIGLPSNNGNTNSVTFQGETIIQDGLDARGAKVTFDDAAALDFTNASIDGLNVSKFALQKNVSMLLSLSSGPSPLPTDPVRFDFCRVGNNVTVMIVNDILWDMDAGLSFIQIDQDDALNQRLWPKGMSPRLATTHCPIRVRGGKNSDSDEIGYVEIQKATTPSGNGVSTSFIRFGLSLAESRFSEGESENANTGGIFRQAFSYETDDLFSY